MSEKNRNSKREINLDYLRDILGNERYQHTKCVLKAALKLAEELNLNSKKVRTAALLHDIAKGKDFLELKELIKESKWEVSELELSIPPVLHAPAGAVIAEKEFGIDDQEILEAIRYHTLGHSEMGKMARVIYVADFISEDRNFDGLDEIRLEVEKNFEHGLYLIVSHIIKYQLKENNIIHPYSNDLRNQLIKRSD